MSTRWPVIDADGHVMEREWEIREHLRKPYSDLEWVGTYSMFPSLDGWVRGFTSPGQRDDPDAPTWLRFLDDCRIERSYLYPTAGLASGLIQDRDWAVALTRAYNDWIYHRFMQVSPRLIGMAIVPVQAPAEAAKELKRAVRDLGMPGACLPAVTVTDRPYGHPEHAPLLEAANELGCVISIHGAVSFRLGIDQFDSFIKTHTLEHPFGQMIQMTSLMFDGAFERYPNIRWAFLEAGVGWVPYMMDRLDEEWERRGRRWSPDLKRKPSEVLRQGNIYFSCEVEERTIPYVVDTVGADQILWASDYPHERERHQYLGDVPEFAAREDLSDETKRKVLHDNAERLYAVEAAAGAGRR
jgi:predicted TIM-barrel fold metal-dependent hydrolase